MGACLNMRTIKIFLIDILVSIYILIKLRNKGSKKVAFGRHAFIHDINSIYGKDVIVLNTEFIRKLLSYLDNEYLEQITCLYHEQRIRQRLKLSRKIIFKNLKNNTLIFGGLDYFEFVAFCPKDIDKVDIDVDAVFHENYAIEYIEKINVSMYEELIRLKMWDGYSVNKIFVYGPPAKRVLGQLAVNLEAEICELQSPRINILVDKPASTKRKRSVLIYAYPGIEYIAPINFTTLLTVLEGIEGVQFYVKFKQKKQIPKLTAKNIKFIYTKKQVDEIFSECAFGLTFNSITLYELISSNLMVLIPDFLDAKQPANMRQSATAIEQSGSRSIIAVSSIAKLTDLLKNMELKDVVSAVEAERSLRLEILRKAYYVNLDK